MRGEEEEWRERFEEGATALYNQARDIALATYDGDAAGGSGPGLGAVYPRDELGESRHGS